MSNNKAAKKANIQEFYNRILPYLAKWGHTIKNTAGTIFTSRNSLKFSGDISVTDDETNDQTIITPHELTQEELTEIMLNNPPSARQNFTEYSTEEQIIGRWIDGKPLYQKTFTGSFGSPVTSTKRILRSATISFPGIELKDSYMSATFTRNSITITYANNSTNMSTNGSIIWCTSIRYDITNQNLLLELQTNTDDSLAITGTPTYIATIKYTKTTD